MKHFVLGLLGCACLAFPCAAQDLQSQEIVVTGSRIDQDDYSNEMPAVGLRRAADFLVQEVTVRGDTREEEDRRREIWQMLQKAVELAPRHGVELAVGDYILAPLTLDTIEELTLRKDNRPDSERIDFLVKAKLAGTSGGAAAEKRIGDFIKAVPEVGRAQMDKSGDPTLSIVGPDSFRPQIADTIADDARSMADRIGDGYAVEIEGLNMPVQWARSGPAEVLLYIPYELRIVPKP